MQNPDYIIVGSGPAGSAVAGRLSEDRNRNVLVLEAGSSDRKLIIAMPAAVPFTYMHPKLNWGESAGPEPFLEGQFIEEKRGRVLGGGSSINAMIFNRGNPKDFDGWAQMGLEGWSWDSVLPYFKRMESYRSGVSDTRGSDGPLKVMRCRAEHVLYEKFVRSGEEAGHALPTDHNNGDQEGVHIAQAYIDDGYRCNGPRAYLHPHRNRTNLSVRTNSHVHKVLFDGDRATGVQLVSGEKIYAREEVIVAASTVGAAQLLLLSGVGPADQLQEHDIDVVADLPHVGQNLENHPGVNLQYESKYEDSIVSQLNLIGQAKLGLQWLLTRKGLGAANFFEAGAFLRSNDRVDYPNVQFEFLPLARRVENGKLKVVPGFQVFIDLSRPTSRGTIELVSNDPKTAPRIVFNHLKEEQDRRDIVDSVKLARDMFAQPVWDGVRGAEIQPGSQVQTDADILSWAKKALGSGYHPSGSCRMSTSSEDGVVDAKCRVHGLKSLRVVCGAVMPRIVTANLSASIYMIAEKIADDIRGHAEVST